MALRINQADPAQAPEKWVDFDDEISFKLTPLSDDSYRIAIERARRLIAREDAKQDLLTVSATATDCDERSIQSRLLGMYIVKDWRGPIEDAQGNGIEYSAQAASALMRTNAGVLAWVIQQAAKIAADHATEVAESMGKPLPDSSGKDGGLAEVTSKN